MIRLNKYKSYNILIIVLSLCCLLVGVMEIFAYQQPESLKEATGTVQKFNQRDEKWYDYIFGGTSSGSYFNVTFEDGSYFEATGICYDNIDRALFGNLKSGKQITVTYDEAFGRPYRIYAIKYENRDYLILNDVLSDFQQEEKLGKSIGIILIALSLTAGTLLLIVNYRKNYGKEN